MRETVKAREVELNNVDEFLNIVFWTQFKGSGAIGEVEKALQPVEEILEEKLDSVDYDNAYDKLWSGFNEIVRRAGIAGMKMAIAIENGEYTMFA